MTSLLINTVGIHYRIFPVSGNRAHLVLLVKFHLIDGTERKRKKKENQGGKREKERYAGSSKSVSFVFFGEEEESQAREIDSGRSAGRVEITETEGRYIKAREGGRRLKAVFKCATREISDSREYSRVTGARPADSIGGGDFASLEPRKSTRGFCQCLSFLSFFLLFFRSRSHSQVASR